MTRTENTIPTREEWDRMMDVLDGNPPRRRDQDYVLSDGNLITIIMFALLIGALLGIVTVDLIVVPK